MKLLALGLVTLAAVAPHCAAQATGVSFTNLGGAYWPWPTSPAGLAGCECYTSPPVSSISLEQLFPSGNDALQLLTGGGGVAVSDCGPGPLQGWPDACANSSSGYFGVTILSFGSATVPLCSGLALVSADLTFASFNITGAGYGALIDLGPDLSVYPVGASIYLQTVILGNFVGTPAPCSPVPFDLGLSDRFECTFT